MIAIANSLLLSSFSVVLILLIATCWSQPRFEHPSVTVSNNSYIFYEKIIYFEDMNEEDDGLKCVTNMSIDCCHDTNVANWRDERGELVQEGADDGTCLYVTRGDGVISLNRRNSDCIPATSGLWRCDIPDSSGEIQSLYIYISNDESYGKYKLFAV